MIKPWPTIRSTPVGDFRIFKMRSDVKISPRTGLAHDFFVLDSVDWVNVIALTPDGRLVMVEQYRQGSNTVELEVPGGVMDPGETDPVVTAVRELREETGYEGEHVRVLGRVLANPAILTNHCYTVLIENCRLKHPLDQDSGEDLATRLVPAAEANKLVAEEKIQHSLVVVALFHFDLWRRGIKTVAG
jgi:8-oxo-dGTP pyrophosphatase MutT (NUDIX family)